MFYYYSSSDIKTKDDRSMIEEIIADGSEYDLEKLLLNPHVTDEDLLNISHRSFLLKF